VSDVSPVFSFPPIARRDARLLILGSMPGVASLQASEYYAHPHNAFWPIIASLLGFDRALPYAQRVRRLLKARVAVWDVLQSCVRSGSGDAAIVPDSVIVNDFAGFFAAHPHIRHVYFNGSKAEQCFRKHVRLPDNGLQFTRLPSTSPAHASLSFEKKQAKWKVIGDGGNGATTKKDRRLTGGHCGVVKGVRCSR